MLGKQAHAPKPLWQLATAQPQLCTVWGAAASHTSHTAHVWTCVRLCGCLLARLTSAAPRVLRKPLPCLGLEQPLLGPEQPLLGHITCSPSILSLNPLQPRWRTRSRAVRATLRSGTSTARCCCTRRWCWRRVSGGVEYHQCGATCMDASKLNAPCMVAAGGGMRAYVECHMHHAAACLLAEPPPSCSIQ